MRFLFLFLSCLTLGACQQQPSGNKNQPLNPETTVRQWQAYMDKNDFKNAQLLSSIKTKQWLQGIEAAFPDDSLQMHTEFEEITCEENGDKAMCVCRIKQNIADESYEDVFLLVKENGQWAIDLDNSDDINSDFLETTIMDSIKNTKK